MQRLSWRSDSACGPGPGLLLPRRLSAEDGGRGRTPAGEWACRQRRVGRHGRVWGHRAEASLGKEGTQGSVFRLAGLGAPLRAEPVRRGRGKTPGASQSHDHGENRVGKATGSPGPHRSVCLHPTPPRRGWWGPLQGRVKQERKKLETKTVMLEGGTGGPAFTPSAPQNRDSVNILLFLGASSGLSSLWVTICILLIYK